MQALLLPAKILTLFIASVCAIADTQNRMRNRNKNTELCEKIQNDVEDENKKINLGKILQQIDEQNLTLCEYCDNCIFLANNLHPFDYMQYHTKQKVVVRCTHYVIYTKEELPKVCNAFHPNAKAYLLTNKKVEENV